MSNSGPGHDYGRETWVSDRPPAPSEVWVDTELVTAYRRRHTAAGDLVYITDGRTRIVLPVNTGIEVRQVQLVAYALLRAVTRQCP